MKILIFTFGLILFVSLTGNVFGGELKEIELNDGTMIYGEIISFSSGYYTISSELTGSTQINESDIKVIRSDPGQRSNDSDRALSQSAINAGINAIKFAMQKDSSTMQSIGALQDDPVFSELLADTAIMTAVEANDIETLMHNPKFIKLLGNPAVNSIGSDLKQ